LPTYNLGIQTQTDFGIKLDSNANIEISARRVSLPDDLDLATSEAGLFSTTG